MPIQPGEFWVADIPFTDGSGSKKRPVLVLWLDGMDVVVAAVTTAAPCLPTDVSLTDWTAAGLRLPSTVRLSRLDCLEQLLLIHPHDSVFRDTLLFPFAVNLPKSLFNLLAQFPVREESSERGDSLSGIRADVPKKPEE